MQVPTEIELDPTKPVFPQEANRITNIIDEAEAKAEKITSQNTEHLPTVFFSYCSAIVIILIWI